MYPADKIVGASIFKTPRGLHNQDNERIGLIGAVSGAGAGMVGDVLDFAVIFTRNG